MKTLSGDEAQQLIDKAKALGYSPQSGAQEDWAKANAYRVHGEVFVEALLKGDGVVYGASKVLYAWPSGEATVQEIYGQQSAPDAVSVKIWLDGSLVEDQNIVNTAASGET